MTSVRTGSRISLTCDSAHSGADLWKFVKDGSEEFGYQGNRQIVISAYRDSTDKGSYSCQAKDSMSGLESEMSEPLTLGGDQ